MASGFFLKLKGSDVGGVATALKTVLDQRGITGLHCTNGTYMYPAERVVPTTLAGFKYLDEKVSATQDAFLVALNSNVSMANIMDQKNASDAERASLESEDVRASKVAEPLQQLFPHRAIVVLFYDQDTPNQLYGALSEAGLDMKSLHKWGYGTNPQAAKIEATEYFSQTFGFPTPDDTKPVCYGITKVEDQTNVVSVVKLTEAAGSNGKPYISKAGKLGFDVPASLAQYQQPVSRIQIAPPGTPHIA